MKIRPYLALPALVGALLGGAVAAHAQSAASPAPATSAAPDSAGHARHRGALRRALDAAGLTSDQKTQIQSFMKTYRDSRQSANPLTRRQLIAQIDGALTPEQRTRFDAALQHRGGAPEVAPSAAP